MSESMTLEEIMIFLDHELKAQDSMIIDVDTLLVNDIWQVQHQ